MTTMQAFAIEPQLRGLPPDCPGPPGGKRDRNRRRRIQALMQAALDLFLDRGLRSVPVDEIAREAGMTKSNLYRYFDGRDDLVGALLGPVGDQLSEATRECARALQRAEGQAEPTEGYRKLGCELARLLETHAGVIRLYLQERRNPEGAAAPIRRLSDRIARDCIELTRIACDRGLMRVHDPRISAYVVIGAAEELIMASFQQRLEAPADDVIASVVHLVLDGIRA